MPHSQAHTTPFMISEYFLLIFVESQPADPNLSLNAPTCKQGLLAALRAAALARLLARRPEAATQCDIQLLPLGVRAESTSASVSFLCILRWAV